MWTDWSKCLKSFWEIDRIRVAYSEGEWFRIAPGDLVERGDSYFEVLKVSSKPEETLVVAECAAGRRTVRLLVAPGPYRYHPNLQWEEAGGRVGVDSSELTLWPRNPNANPFKQRSKEPSLDGWR